MAVKNIFKCIGNEVANIPDKIIEDIGASYEEINNDAEKIVELSKALKEENNTGYCVLPFCHTVEAEAFGSKITYDHKFGNRIKEPAITDLNSVEDLKDFDLNSGRIGEVLKAISILKDQGEDIVFDITGPITTATSVTSSEVFFKAIRKDKDNIFKLLKIIEDNTVAYILEGIKRGATVVSLGDPAGTLDIVGPKTYRDFSGKTMYSILKRIEDQLGDSVIHLCGKASTSLKEIDLLETEEINVDGDNYIEMIKNAKQERPDTKFIGNWCLKTNKKRKNIISFKLL